jgi:hypothetical protein
MTKIVGIWSNFSLKKLNFNYFCQILVKNEINLVKNDKNCGFLFNFSKK